MADRDVIDKLARAVAERSPVSWEDELRSAADHDGRDVVEQLRVVHRIVEAHWGPSGAPTRLGDFEVVREIGRGYMGVVYEARQVSLDRRVALKVLAPELTGDAVRLQRFEREAKTLASLNHPNIVTIHSVQKIDQVHFITMELVEGQPLSFRIPGGGMPVDKLLDVAIAMADALSSAHKHHIVHRDLKPANIMISEEGRVKVLDFGLAKLHGLSRISGETPATTADVNVTRDGFVVGTVPYMSPEQAGAREIDHRSDVFSLGTIIYEMATGRRPFKGGSQRDVIVAIGEETPTPVTRIRPELPDDLDRIIAHCHRKDPDHRYQTAKGLRNELDELKKKRALGKLPQPPVSKWPMWAAIVAAAVLLVALLAGDDIGRWVKGLLGWPEPQARYLAVLPLTHPRGGNTEINAFSDGLTEMLTAKLTRLTNTHELQIAPASAVRQDPPLTVATIAKELGVTLVLECDLQQSGNEVRVSISLVDVREQKLLSAEVINGTVGDAFAFQDQVVVAAVEMLDLELPPIEAEALRAHGTTVPAAHELYLQGRGYLLKYDEPDNVDRAIATFQRSLAKDPNYAQAHAGLGRAYWKRYDDSKDRQWVDRASEACGRAVELNEELAAGYVCLGQVYLGTGDYGEATTAFGWAMSKDPTSDEAYRGMARVFERIGQLESAEVVYLKAVAERPHYWATHNWLGAFYFRNGQLEKAEQSFNEVIKLAPDGYRGHQNLGGVYLAQGNYNDAIRVSERSVDLKPTGHNLSNLASAYFGRGQFDQSAKYNEKATELGPNEYAVWGNLGEAYYWMPGAREKSREPYLRAVELAEKQLEVNPDAPEILGELGKYNAMLGNREEALAFVKKAEEKGIPNADLEFNTAIVYSQLGEPGVALDWLEKSVANGTQTTWIRSNPVFNRLRAEERFQQLIQ